MGLSFRGLTQAQRKESLRCCTTATCSISMLTMNQGNSHVVWLQNPYTLNRAQLLAKDSAMKTISQFLDQSKRPVYSVGPNATVREALEIMAQHNIGALLVMDGETLKGIFSERDYARKVALKGKSSNDAKVSDVMTSNVITINTKHSIDQCMQIMTDKHIRHLPIVNDVQVIGLISIGDVVREMIAYQKSMIEQLQSYIAG